MFAIIAAVIFALSLLFDLFEVTVGDAFDATTLLFAGLLCLALHLAGFGSAARWRRR
jgi:hypothetical protein